MNQETKDFRELKFVCPKCGANSLRAEVSGYLDIEHVYESGLFTWGQLYPEEIGEYRCRECGYQLELSEDVGLQEWLMSRCNQTEPDA